MKEQKAKTIGQQTKSRGTFGQVKGVTQIVKSKKVYSRKNFNAKKHI